MLTLRSIQWRNIHWIFIKNRWFFLKKLIIIVINTCILIWNIHKIIIKHISLILTEQSWYVYVFILFLLSWSIFYIHSNSAWRLGSWQRMAVFSMDLILNTNFWSWLFAVGWCFWANNFRDIINKVLCILVMLNQNFRQFFWWF
jgi:hypothetical protein